VKNLPPIGIRSPDRPARSESRYRLSYPGPRYINMTKNRALQVSRYVIRFFSYEPVRRFQFPSLAAVQYICMALGGQARDFVIDLYGRSILTFTSQFS
jgi:hypothetical protein